jgi:predicted ester cyclase
MYRLPVGEMLRLEFARDPIHNRRSIEMSTTETNKAAVRTCFENASLGNYDALHEVVSEDFVLNPDGVRGVDGLAQMVERYRSALADLRVTIEHQFTEGDYVATRSTIRGRHEGELMGTPPTGRDVEFSCLTISRCRDGKIGEEWELTDNMSLLRQIGALPAMAEA